MAGKCFACANSFSFWNKEHGCKNCGYSFCNGCLTKKEISVPKLMNKKHKVCQACYKKISNPSSATDEPKQVEPPDTYYKRLAALAERTTDDQTVRQPQTGEQASTSGTGMTSRSQDADIRRRLDELKKDRAPKNIPTESEMRQRLDKLKEDERPTSLPQEDEIRSRLAVLKDQDPSTANKPHVFKTERRTEQQQVDDLLTEIHDEVKLDTGHGDVIPDDLQNNLNTDGAAKHTVTHKNIWGEENCEEDFGEAYKFLNILAAQNQEEAEKAMASMDEETKAKVDEILKQAKNRKVQNVTDITETDDNEDTIGGENDDYTNADKVLKRILEEQKLDEGLNAGTAAAGTTTSKPAPTIVGSGSLGPIPAAPVDLASQVERDDELPWCCICNNDATLRCQGCDGDLYCQRCYREGHDREDYSEHSTVKYVQK